MLEKGMDVDEYSVENHPGRKRPPDDELTSEQRLTKRFHLLDLDNARQLYVPTQQRSPSRRPRANAVSDSMHLEDSKHRVYIYDLDEELASADSEEEKLIFLPDIERKLANLPKSVLASETPPKGNEIVLYSVPESLSVPRKEDNVRRAIYESRARAREAQISGTASRALNYPSQISDNGSFGAAVTTSHAQDSHIHDDEMDLGN